MKIKIKIDFNNVKYETDSIEIEKEIGSVNEADDIIKEIIQINDKIRKAKNIKDEIKKSSTEVEEPVKPKTSIKNNDELPF